MRSMPWDTRYFRQVQLPCYMYTHLAMRGGSPQVKAEGTQQVYPQ